MSEWENAKLHLGCGSHHLDGWVNADGLAGSPAVDRQLDILEPWPIPRPGVLARIYWSHGPEHIPPDLLTGVLVRCREALKPGGCLTVATIDLVGIFRHRFEQHDNGAAWNAALYGECGSQDHPFLAHRQCFTTETLTAQLRAAGFPVVRPWCTEQYPEIHALNDYARSCALVTCYAEGVVR